MCGAELLEVSVLFATSTSHTLLRNFQVEYFYDIFLCLSVTSGIQNYIGYEN